MEHHRLYQFPFARYPAVRLVLLLVAGIVLDSSLQPAAAVWMLLFLAALTGYLTFESSNPGSLHAGKYRAAIGCYILCVVFFGGGWHGLHSRYLQPAPVLAEALAGEKLGVYGQLRHMRRSSTGNYQLDVDVDSTVFADTLTWRHPYTMRTVLDPDELPVPDPIFLGAALEFSATVLPLHEKRNPHDFDYKRYLASQGILLQAGIDSIHVITRGHSSLSWSRLRQQVLSLIEQIFNQETASLAKALLIGYKDELSIDQKQAFSRAGLSHIMAVSGLHVGFLLTPFWLLTPLFWTLRWGKHTGLVFLAALLFLYAGLTGFSASVVRASLTGGFIMYGRLFHKVRDSRNLTSAAALLILLYDPTQLYDIGFQLSFSAVYIILLAMPVLNSWLLARLRYRWYGKPVLIILVSLLVQAGLYPLLSYYFGEFSLAGPLANALVVPPLMFLVPYSLALLPVSACDPALGQWLNTPSQWFLHLLEQFVQTTSSMEGSWIATPASGPILFLIWTSALCCLATLSIPRLRWKHGCVLLTLLCIQQAGELYKKVSRPQLQVIIFDVGQADAALVRTPLGRHFLIDTGRWSPGYNSARQVIIPHLKAAGITRLDAVFLSHPHADHIGGIGELIQSIPIDTIYNSGYRYNSRLYRTYLHQAADAFIPVRSLSAGDVIPLDPSMRILIYGPEPGPGGSDPNEHSLVMELVYGNTEFLFTGDAGHQQEARLLHNFGRLLDTDFLKVGHHGSRTSSSHHFLHTITPRQAVVSLAKVNRFGHPHPEAIQRLRQSQAQLHFTSLQGAVIFHSDGDSIYRQNWR